GLSVIAEGIEGRATADLLMQMGCEQGQGYYFGRPMPAPAFESQFLAAPVTARRRARQPDSQSAGTLALRRRKEINLFHRQDQGSRKRRRESLLAWTAPPFSRRACGQSWGQTHCAAGCPQRYG